MEPFVPLKSSMIGVSAVGLMTAALLVIGRHFTHPQIVEHLAFGYMLPIAAVAMLFGGAAGTVATAVSNLAASFFLFPPKFAFWIDNPFQLGELFWLAVLGYVASRAAGGLLRR
jgi:K+-sensing histidine kinase KdpD